MSVHPPNHKRRRWQLVAAGAIALSALGFGIDEFVAGDETIEPDAPSPRDLARLRLCEMSQATDTPSAAAVPDPAFVNELTPSGGGRIDNYRYWPGNAIDEPRWYVSQRSDDASPDLTILVYDGQYRPVDEVVVAAERGGQIADSFAVDDSTGDVFLAERLPDGRPAVLSRWDLDGSKRWDVTLDGALSGSVYSLQDEGGATVVGAVVGGTDTERGRSNVVTTDGTRLSDALVAGTDVRMARTHGDDLVSLEDGGVAVYDPTGTERRFLINNRITGRTTWDFQVAGANLLADGTIVATSYNSRSMAFFDPDGALLGIIGADRGAGQPLEVINHSSPIEIVGARLVYKAQNPFSAPNSLTSIPVDSARQLFEASPSLDFLGLGAGLVASAPYNFFPADTPPAVSILFSEWWQQEATTYEGSYTVRSIAEATAQEPAVPQRFVIPADPAAYEDGVATLPIAPLPDEPGYYEISVTLGRDGEIVGTDCLGFSVGSEQLDLDFTTIEASQSDVRGVQLAEAFGQRLYRSSYNLYHCLDNVQEVDGATTIACSDDMISDINRAVALAESLGVVYEFQLGDDKAVNASAVRSGQWERLVGELATRLPAIRNWECWNEPNNNTFESVEDYVDSALQPCWNALKAVSAENVVIGGSFLNVALDDWKDFVVADGLAFLDVVATHPYTGHNRSYEEQGHVVPASYAVDGELGSLQELQQLLADAGYEGEIFNTESGFWNQGPGSYYTQGNKLIRKTILQESIGLEHSYNFFNDGEYQVEGVTWALLTDVLTPGGLSASTFRSVIGDRTFDAWLPTGMPHGYAARYVDPSGGQPVVVVWTDDFLAELIVVSEDDSPISVIDQYGATRSVASGDVLQVSGGVQYLSLPSGADTIELRPVKAFGVDLAASEGGATATASSVYACDTGVTLDAQRALDATTDARDTGNNCDGEGMSVWAPLDTDKAPELVITFPAAEVIDRVFVAGKGLGSIETGLRSYTIEVAGEDGEFREVARIDDAFFDRSHLLWFDPVSATALRISDIEMNYSGYGDGSRPSFWNEEFRGLGGIYAVEVYGPEPGSDSGPSDI